MINYSGSYSEKKHVLSDTVMHKSESLNEPRNAQKQKLTTLPAC